MAHVKPGFGIACHCQTDEICHGTAADHQAARLRWEADDLLAPIHHLTFHKVGDMVGSTQVGIHRRRQKIRQCSQYGAITHKPTPKTWVNVAHRVGEDILLEFLVNLGCFLSIFGERLVECLVDLRREWLPHGALLDGHEIIQHVVQHAMTKQSHRVPVLGVKRKFWVSFCSHSVIIHRYLPE